MGEEVERASTGMETGEDKAGRCWVEKGSARGRSRQGAQRWDAGSLFHGTGQEEDRVRMGRDSGEFEWQEVSVHSLCSKSILSDESGVPRGRKTCCQREMGRELSRAFGNAAAEDQTQVVTDPQ